MSPCWLPENSTCRLSVESDMRKQVIWLNLDSHHPPTGSRQHLKRGGSLHVTMPTVYEQKTLVMRKIMVVAIHATITCVLQKLKLSKGLPGGTGGREHVRQCRKHERLEFDPDIKKIPWGTARPPTPVFLPGESHRQMSLAGYSP